jgi:hypothetical protein
MVCSPEIPPLIYIYIMVVLLELARWLLVGVEAVVLGLVLYRLRCVVGEGRKWVVMDESGCGVVCRGKVGQEGGEDGRMYDILDIYIIYIWYMG